MNSIYILGLCAALTLPALGATQQIAIEISQVKRPELKGSVLSYAHRLVDVDSLAKGINIGYRYEAPSGAIITHPIKEARPQSCYILEDGSPKYVLATQGWHTFRYPNAKNKHVSEAVLNIQRSPQGDPIYVDGAMRAQVSQGMATSPLLSLEEEEGALLIGGTEASYKKFIYRGSLSIEIVMDKTDVLDEFYFHDAEGNHVKPTMNMMTGMRQYKYTYSFDKAYPAALSYRYKQAPYDVEYPIQLSLLGKSEVMEGNATGDIRAQVAEFQLQLKPETLAIASGKLRLLVSAPKGSQLSLVGEQELALSTVAGEALPPLKLMPKDVCYDKNSKQMYILADLPDIKGNTDIQIKGELKLKADGQINTTSSESLNTEQGGCFPLNGGTINYAELPVDDKSPWCYLAFYSLGQASALMDSSFAPIFLDAQGQQLSSSPQLINPQQREQLGLDADTPVKLYRFRKSLPSAIQTNSKQEGELSIPVALELQLGASPKVPELPEASAKR